jgi:hypothetical protein
MARVVSIIRQKRRRENGSGRAEGIIRITRIIRIQGETETETGIEREREIGIGKHHLRRRSADGRKTLRLRVLEVRQ